MKRIFILTICLTFYYTSYSQFHLDEINSSVQVRLERTGTSTGITDFGTDDGGLHFWVGGYDQYTNSEFTIKNDGYVGIGTFSPQRKLHLGDISTSAQVRLERTGTYAGITDFGTDNIGLHFWVGGYDQYDNAELTLKNNGYVGIGTTDPQSKLSVNGEIRATEIKVLADISVPDFVFEPNYELPTLKEIKEYINQNKHLPGIPSATEIGASGIDLGDMNMRLLQKIEELTLYQIELMEKLEEQQKRIEHLERGK